MTKQKSRRKSSSGLLFTAKILQEAMCLTYPYMDQITYNQNFTPQCKILNVFWTLIASKRRIEQLNYFDWLSNDKNLVLSNGFDHVRNVIQWDLNRFFSKILQKSPSGWELCPQTPIATGSWGLPSVIRFSTLAYSTRPLS